MNIKGREMISPSKQLRFTNLAVPFVRVADLGKAENPEQVPVYMKVAVSLLPGDAPALADGDWTVVNLTDGRVTGMPGAEQIQVINASLVVGG